MSTMSLKTSQPSIQYFDIVNFRFQDGTVLPTARIAYLDINPTASKLALIPTCFRGTLYSTLTFSTGALANHRIIVAALFGNGQSSSSSNTPNFPTKIDYRDCVAAQHALLTQHLQVTGQIDVIVGFSMGGQCAWYWTALHPDIVARAVIICSSARTSAHNRQFLEGPASALVHSVDYVAGQTELEAAQDSGAVTRFQCPRGIHAFAKAYSAWLYSAEWFEQEEWRKLGHKSTEAWDEEATGSKYDGWYADDLLSMLRMWQAGDVGVCFCDAEIQERENGRKPLKDVLSKIEAPVLLMPCSTDKYFRWEVNEKEVKLVKNGKLEVISSIWGHTAGSGAHKDDVDWMNAKIATFLREN